MAAAQFTEQFLANIPSVYGRTLKEFYEQLIQTSPVHRIEFLSEIIDGQGNSLPKFNWSNGKNDEISKHFRALGNACFVKWEYVEALKYYNRALAHAKNRKNVGVCYANRSAVYYELSMYELCLENIEIARRYKLKEAVKTKLEQRQTAAQSQLLLTPPAKPQRKYVLRLSRPQASRSRPFFVDCLDKPVCDIITTKPLSAGEVISMEKPYSQILSRSHIYERCTYCLTNKKYLSMFPCRGCSSAMFCNHHCYYMAMKTFHCMECPIIDGLFHFLTDSMYLGLRTVITSLGACHGSFDQYRNMLMNCFDNDADSFEFNVSATTSKTFNEMVFATIHNLSRSFKFSLQHHLVTAVLMDKLKQRFEVLFTDSDPDSTLVLSTSIFHMLQVSAENNVLLEETAFSGDGVGNDVTVYGCGLYPFASQFKLECAPNVIFLNNGNGTLTGVVLRPIGIGEKIIPGIMSRNHFLTDINRRNERILTSGSELCHCSACQHEFKSITELLDRDIEFDNTIPLMPETFANTNEIFVALKTVCNYINRKKFQNYLCSEMGLCTQEMIRLLRQIVEAYGTDAIFTKCSRSKNLVEAV